MGAPSQVHPKFLGLHIDSMFYEQEECIKNPGDL